MSERYYDKKGIPHVLPSGRDSANWRYAQEEQQAQAAQLRQAELQGQQPKPLQLSTA